MIAQEFNKYCIPLLKWCPELEKKFDSEDILLFARALGDKRIEKIKNQLIRDRNAKYERDKRNSK